MNDDPFGSKSVPPLSCLFGSRVDLSEIFLSIRTLSVTKFGPSGDRQDSSRGSRYDETLRVINDCFVAVIVIDFP